MSLTGPPCGVAQEKIGGINELASVAPGTDGPVAAGGDDDIEVEGVGEPRALGALNAPLQGPGGFWDGRHAAQTNWLVLKAAASLERRALDLGGAVCRGTGGDGEDFGRLKAEDREQVGHGLLGDELDEAAGLHEL